MNVLLEPFIPVIAINLLRACYVIGRDIYRDIYGNHGASNVILKGQEAVGATSTTTTSITNFSSYLNGDFYFSFFIAAVVIRLLYRFNVLINNPNIDDQD